MSREPEPLQYMLTGAVAKRLKVTPEAVCVMERRGEILAQRTSTGVRLFHPAAVEKLAAEREKKKRR